jgi:hypothetical protein
MLLRIVVAAQRGGHAFGLLALVAFLLDYVVRLWRPAESIAWLSPFRYYALFELVMGNALPSKNLIMLGASQPRALRRPTFCSREEI